ncbi:MAG TPA: hypothetical protein GX524_02970 [Firmicutes bacterium]|jgi:hypothetical protein|nr:hypothetical protein [Bacillota bacterium]
MKKTVLAVTLAVCCVLCGCGHNAESTDVVVKVLDPNKIVGVLPTEVSRVNGDQNRTPSVLVGAFSHVDNNRGECLVVIRISPQWSSSTLGNVLVKEMSLPTIGKTSGTVTVSELHGIVTSSGNREVLGYFLLSETFGDSLHKDTEIQLYDKWDSDSTATFAFPVYVCSDRGIFNLRSLMNGSTFHLDEALPEEITGAAIDSKSDAESIPVSSCGIAIFTISESKTDHEFLVHLLAFLKLDKGST